MEFVLIALFVIFIAVSAIECYFIYGTNAAPKQTENRQIILIPVYADAADIEAVLRNTMKMIRSSDYGCRAVIADMGMDEESAQICQKMQQQFPLFEIVSGDKISELLP